MVRGDEVSRRDDRWLAIDEDTVAFAVDDDAGWRRLEQEAWILERWRAAGVPAARVVRIDAARRIQVRERLHGVTGDVVEPRIFGGTPPDAIARLEDAPITPFGERLAESYGELAARIRSATDIDDARAADIAESSRRTLDLGCALAELDASAASPHAKRAAHGSRDWLARLARPDAVIHADLHFHNMTLADDGTITGVFDLGDAGLDEAAGELLYIHSLGPRFVARALAAYGAVDVEAVRRAHLRTILGHLRFHGPGTPRHASIVQWASAAFERLTRDQTPGV